MNNIIEKLDTIMEHLELTIKQVAELFDTPLKTVFDWFDGVIPLSQHDIDRVNVLIKIIDVKSPDIDLADLKTVWKIHISGKSFHGIFNGEVLDNNELYVDLLWQMRVLSTNLNINKTTQQIRTQLGEAHLAEFDKLIG